MATVLPRSVKGHPTLLLPIQNAPSHWPSFAANPCCSTSGLRGVRHASKRCRRWCSYKSSWATRSSILAVSEDADDAAYKQFVRDHNVDLLTVRDPKNMANTLYGTFQFPETYVIDKDGVIRRKFIGAADWTNPEIIEYLNKLQEGKS